MPDLEDSLVALMPVLLSGLDRLETISRRMHPPLLAELAASLGPDDAALTDALAQMRGVEWPEAMTPWRDRIVLAGESVLRANAGLREGAALGVSEGFMTASRAARQQYRAIEALYPLAHGFGTLNRFFIEPGSRGDTALLERLDARPGEDTGVFHFDNEMGTRGGFSVYVPEYLRRGTPAPVIFALHGGSGHGRVFLWSWLREARSRGAIVVSPTAAGGTWSLMEPEIDASRLAAMLSFARDRWEIDPTRMLLTGMSDGGTFSLLAGLDADSPFTHLAPVAASFHPMLVTMTEPGRIQGLPIYLVHGALDWMFPIHVGRTAHRALTMAGARVTFREIPDLSHTYPRDENPSILDWLMG